MPKPKLVSPPPPKVSAPIIQSEVYDNTVALSRGNCGYRNCKNKGIALPRTVDISTGELAPIQYDIACHGHHETCHKCYRYLGEEVACHGQVNTQKEFADCFENAHQILHGAKESDCREGIINNRRKDLEACDRIYGAFSAQDLFSIMEQQ